MMRPAGPVVNLCPMAGRADPSTTSYGRAPGSASGCRSPSVLNSRHVRLGTQRDTEACLSSHGEARVLAVFKGEKGMKTLVLLHLREAEQKITENGPGLVSFDAQQKKRYLLFLKRETDGRFSPLTGQTDPDGAVKDLGAYP